MIVAIVHDGTMDGDCPLADMTPIKIPANSPKLSQLKNAWKRQMIKEYGENDAEYVEDEINEIKGAWLLEEKTFNQICKGMDYAPEPGNDSSAYAMTSLLKGMFHTFAIKRIGRNPTK